MTFRFGDVVVVPFPFVDHALMKPRPALVISSTGFNTDHSQIILAMITTASRSSWPSDLPIVNLHSAGLRRPSVVRWKVFSRDVASLGSVIGALARADRMKAAERQATVFGIQQGGR